MSDTDAQETPEAEPEPPTTDADAEDETVDDVSPEDLTVEELENQEWTLGGEKEGRISFGGMVFEVEEPDEDEILNMMAGPQGDDGMSSSDRMYKLVESAVLRPEVTPERWRDMKTGQRLGFAFKIAEFAGLQDMMDFPDDGQSLPQEG